MPLPTLTPAQQSRLDQLEADCLAANDAFAAAKVAKDAAAAQYPSLVNAANAAIAARDLAGRIGNGDGVAAAGVTKNAADAALRTYLEQLAQET